VVTLRPATKHARRNSTDRSTIKASHSHLWPQKALNSKLYRLNMNRRVFLSGLTGATVVLAGCSNNTGSAGPNPEAIDEGPPRLGDIQLRNEFTTSQAVHIRVIQNESVVYQATPQVPAQEGDDDGLTTIDPPNISESFIIKARPENRSNWLQLHSEDMTGGGCFAVVAKFEKRGETATYEGETDSTKTPEQRQFEFAPAGKSCEIE